MTGLARRPAAAALLASCAVLLAAGCGSTARQAPSDPLGGNASEPSGRITVFAAASLQEAFTALGTAFEAAHPGTEVAFSFGASSTLAAQVRQGAPADVLATASRQTMRAATGLTATPATFATNTLQIAVPPANPAGITGIADLARPAVKVALCQPAVPCGAAARQVLSAARLAVTPVTLELDVKAVLTKVRLGEVDAGLVYTTDVRAAGSAVRGIDVPARFNVSTDYPIAAVTMSSNPVAARAFVEFALSPEGARTLAAQGFGPP